MAPNAISHTGGIALAVLLISLWPAFGWSNDGRDFSLRERWDRHWNRILDRRGRPDPRGPVFQRFAGEHYPEYPMDLRVAQAPMSKRLSTVQSNRSASVWVASIDELTLANRMELQTRSSVGRRGYLEFEVDRYETRQHDSTLIGVEFGRANIGSTNLDTGLRFYPRWHKEDSDFAANFRYRGEWLGHFRLQIFGIDAFNNASHAILKARDERATPTVWQETPPLAASLDWRSPDFDGLRFEAYLGGVLPAKTTFRFPDSDDANYRRRRGAVLGAAVTEWNLPGPPIDVGVAGFYARAESSRKTLSGSNFSETTETTATLQTYALYQPWDDLLVEANIERTYRPQTQYRSGKQQNREDRSLFASLRTNWSPHSIYGLELQLLRLSRKATGPPDVGVSGTNYRLMTRPTFQFGEHAWGALGVGWDLDHSKNVYDGGGFTMIATW